MAEPSEERLGSGKGEQNEQCEPERSSVGIGLLARPARGVTRPTPFGGLWIYNSATVPRGRGEVASVLQPMALAVTERTGILVIVRWMQRTNKGLVKFVHEVLEEAKECEAIASWTASAIAENIKYLIGNKRKVDPRSAKFCGDERNTGLEQHAFPDLSHTRHTIHLLRYIHQALRLYAGPLQLARR